MIYPSTDPQTELQKLIYETLTADTNLMSLIDGVHDAVPPDPWGPNNGYVSFGPSDVFNEDSECLTNGIHTIQIDCWSRQVGSVHCKRVVDAVYAALHDQPFELSQNGLTYIVVIMRQVFRDPDGLTTHGVIQVEADIQELAA